MASVQSPPITDPTGQDILSKLLDIKKNIHLPIGDGLNVNNSRINVTPHIFSGTEVPEWDLGDTGDIYVRYKWIARDQQQEYAASIYSIYTKMPEGSISQLDPTYNRWKEALTDLVISSGMEPPLPEEGADGDIFLLYEEFFDVQSGETRLEITKLYQKIEGYWTFFAGGVPREEFEVGIRESKHKSLVLFNKNELVLKSDEQNVYKKYLMLERDFVQEYRSPLDFDFEFLMDVVCDPYTIHNNILTINGDTKVRISYEFDNQEFSHYPEQVLEDGPNVLSLHYPVPVVEKQVHNFKIYFEIMNGEVTIPIRGMIGNISGTGIDADGFSGVMVGEDTIPYLDFNNNMFKTVQDNSQPDIGIFNPDIIDGINQGATTGIPRLVFSDNLFSGFIDSIEIEEEQQND